LIEDIVSNRELIARINALSGDALRKVQEFIESLAENQPASGGEAGSNLVKFAGLFPKEDLEEIKSVIEEDCERIDTESWGLFPRHEYRHRAV
jgi:hypothetical protein